MKKISRIYSALMVIFAGCILPCTNFFAQTLSPKVLPAGGGYKVAGGVSLSFTIGETFNTTLQAGNLWLTQGQQQPFAITPHAVAMPSEQTICSGASITTIMLSSNISGTIYTWTRDNVDAVTGIPGNGTGDISGVLTNTTDTLVTVTFTITPTANNITGPVTTASVLVKPASPVPIISPNGPILLCTGGAVTLSSGAAAGNQWFLDGSPIAEATNQDYSATATGIYSVRVTANGCTSAASAGVPVTVNPIPQTPVITAGGPVTFCTGGTVTLSSGTATGNQWFLDGNPVADATSQDYSATATGIYSVIVTANGCTSAASAGVPVTVNPIPQTPVITAAGPVTFCSGGAVTLSSSATTGNQWFLNGSPIAEATNQDYSAIATGTYSVMVTVNGCTSAASAGMPVIVNPIPQTPVITAAGPVTFCSGGSVTLSSSAITGNQWFLNGNPVAGATAHDYSATATGIYSVMVTTNGCTSAASSGMTVTVNPIPVAVATPTSQTICSGTASSIALTGSPTGINFSWTVVQNAVSGASTGTGNLISQTLTATGSVAGKATYTITPQANGCTGAAITATVITNVAPAISLNAGTINCYGGTTLLTATASGGAGGYTFSLNGTGPYQASNTFTVPAGIYTVVVKDALGCTKKSGNITITQSPEIIASVSVGEIACNGDITTIRVTATGGKAPYTYRLSGGASFQVNNYFVVAAGNYTITIQDANGCTKVISPITVSQPPVLTASLNAGTINCNGGTAIITANATGGTASYQYRLDNGNYQSGNSFTTKAGLHIVTIKDAKGCTVSKSVNIGQPPILNLNVLSGVIACYGGTATASAIASGGTPPYTYQLDNGNYQSGNSFAIPAGPHTLTVKDSKGCTTSRTITVTQPALLSLSLYNKTNVSCYGGNNGAIVVTGTGGTTPYSYKINTGSSYQRSNTFSNLIPGTYSITIRDAQGCTAVITGIPVTQPATALALTLVQKNNVTCRNGTNGSVTVSAAGGTPPYRYSLNSGAFGTSNTFTSLRAGIYLVNTIDAGGCTKSVSVVINNGTGNCNNGQSAKQATTAPGKFITAPWLKAAVMPNPSEGEFTLVLTGNSAEPVQISVRDMLGRQVHQAKGSVNATYRFGHGFNRGMYIIEIVQGKKITIVKVVKI